MNPALLTALLAFAPADHRAPPNPHESFEVRCPRDVDAAFAQLDQALYELADDIDDMKGRDKRRLRDNLAQLAAAAEDAREQACRSARRPGPPVVVVPPPPPPPPPRAVVVDNAS